MKKNTNKTSHAAEMVAYAKHPTLALRGAYKKALGKDPTGLSRDTMIKALAAHAHTKRPQAPVATPTSDALKPAATETPRHTGPRDPRLPAPNTVLEREFKGKVHKVTVRQDGFDYAGKSYRSLTAVAKMVTGYAAISGTLFFGIAKPAQPDAESKQAPAAPAKKAKKD